MQIKIRRRSNFNRKTQTEESGDWPLGSTSRLHNKIASDKQHRSRLVSQKMDRLLSTRNSLQSTLASITEHYQSTSKTLSNVLPALTETRDEQTGQEPESADGYNQIKRNLN